MLKILLSVLLAYSLFQTTQLHAADPFGSEAPLKRPPSSADMRRDSPAKNAPGAKFAENEILVRFKDTAASATKAALHGRLGAATIRRYGIVKNLERVRLAEGKSVESTLEEYRSHPDVLYAEPNYILHALALPNDPSFPPQWNLHNTGQNGGTPGADIKAVEAWDTTTGSDQVVIAVIDTGVDYNHLDLAANIWRNEADCNNDGIDDDGNGYVDDCYGIDTYNHDSDPMDDNNVGTGVNNHGTHVAGIIGAVGNNSLGVVGVNWNVKIMPCKFMGWAGYGTLSEALECLDYVKAMKDRGVNIVATNNSWGAIDFYSFALFDAIEAQLQAGVLFIAAAGDYSYDNDVYPQYPANYHLPNVISVTATDRFDKLTFAAYGRRAVHVGAPGVDILSTAIGNTYATLTGTSMAAAHVTGVAALLKAQDPSRDWRSIKNLILTGVDPAPSLERTLTQGRLNAQRSQHCVDSTLLKRTLPTEPAITALVGVAIDLDVIHIKCAAPNGEVQVTVSPGGEILTLRDDGVLPDRAAGDGIYSAQWTPAMPGIFSLTFPDGDQVPVRVLSARDSDLFGFSDYYPIGSWPEGVVIGDLNGDGRNDVVVVTNFYADPENDYQVHVFLQQADGKLALPKKYPTGGSYNCAPASVAIGDVNHDGRPDILVGNSGCSLAVLLQNSSGEFDAPVLYPTLNSRSIKIADLNNDGLLDVVGLGGFTNSVNSVEVFLQNVNGTLNPSITYAVLEEGWYPTVDAADVNHDGLTDIVFTNSWPAKDPVIGVMLQKPAGGFNDPVYYPMPTTQADGIGSAAVGDVDGDGLSDVAVTFGGNFQFAHIATMHQNGSGTLDAPTVYPSLSIPESVVVADVNGDGKKDVLVLHQGWEALGVYLQAPNGALFPEELYWVPRYQSGLAVGDINGDGLPDVVVVTQSLGVVILYNDPRATPWQATLTITRSGTGRGTVKSDQWGIDCGQDCIETYDGGNSVSLSVTPDPSSTFTGWTGDADCADGIVTMLTDKTCIANFVAGRIHVFEPSAAAVWPRKKKALINWGYAPTPTVTLSTVRIDISFDGGSTWTPLVKKMRNTMMKYWKVAGPPTTQAKIRVCSIDAPLVCDTSAAFTIQ